MLPARTRMRASGTRNIQSRTSQSFLDLELRWLKLARSYEVSERLRSFPSPGSTDQKPFESKPPPVWFYAVLQRENLSAVVVLQVSPGCRYPLRYWIARTWRWLGHQPHRSEARCARLKFPSRRTMPLQNRVNPFGKLCNFSARGLIPRA